MTRTLAFKINADPRNQATSFLKCIGFGKLTSSGQWICLGCGAVPLSLLQPKVSMVWVRPAKNCFKCTVFNVIIKHPHRTYLNTNQLQSASASTLVLYSPPRLSISWTDNWSGLLDLGEQKLPIKQKKGKKFQVLECWMFSSEGWSFSCSLDVLYGGLGISKLQFLILKKCFSSYKIFEFLVIKALDLDPDPDWPKMLYPDPKWNLCRSETLMTIMLNDYVIANETPVIFGCSLKSSQKNAIL